MAHTAHPSRSWIAAAAFAALSLASTASHAVGVPSQCNTLTSASGVSIEECGWQFGSNFGGSYAIQNDSAQAITAFAVSTAGGGSAVTWQELSDWQGLYISEFTWNNTQALRDAGLFATLFGTQEHAAFLYWNGTLTPDGLPGAITGTQALAAGQLHAGLFGFNGALPASEFISFGGTSAGGIASLSPLAASYTAPVPEPGSAAMLFAGLGILGSLAHRRRQRD